MNAKPATDFITANKGTEIVLNLRDGSTVEGAALSVNSKGVNVKIDGKTKSVSLSRIESMDLVTDNVEDYDGADLADDDADAEDAIIEDFDDEDGDDEDEVDAEEEAFMNASEIEDELHDGMTTAQLADLVSRATGTELTPKELRVHLRALGLGVGKGRKYALSAGEFRAVVGVVTPA